MRELGCTRVELGAQAVDDKILKLVKRGHGVEEIKAATKLLKQYGFKVDYHLMPQLPGATPQKDLKMLSDAGTDIVFIPGVSEIYPPGNGGQTHYTLGTLETVLEGKYRPGHFQGVVHVVRNLFNIVQPHTAYFGEKDFQQLAVIRRMVTVLDFNIKIVACPTFRSENGLALSSRNMRLSEPGRVDALIISETMTYMKGLGRELTPREVVEMGKTFFLKGKLDIEYLEIVDAEHLSILVDEWTDRAVCCIAAYCEGVRLIDNLAL
jgi:pantoate--beta-alanine ligase